MKNELVGDYDISETDIIYFPKRKIHNTRLMHDDKERIEIFEAAEKAGYSMESQTEVAYFCSQCKAAIPAQDFGPSHRGQYAQCMFTHVHKKHKNSPKKYMILEVKDRLQVCRANNLNTHSTIQMTAEQGKKVEKAVIKLAYQMSDTLKKEKLFLELGTNVLDEDE